MTRTVLIDGDVALYEVTIACEEAVHWGDDVWTLHSDMKEARERFDCWVSGIKEKLKADKVVIALSGSGNWRKDILPSYKAHRKKKRKPLVYPELKKYCHEVYKTYQIENLEADDVLGLLSGDPGLGKIKGEKVIVTIDKDLKTIPGLHYNPQKPELGIVEVTLDQANYNHLMQSLTGDSVDGYSGCPGVGPVTAERILQYPCWGAVLEAYGSAGLSEDEALIQAQVARILRWGEYDLKKKEPVLWQPSTAKNS